VPAARMVAVVPSAATLQVVGVRLLKVIAFVEIPAGPEALVLTTKVLSGATAYNAGGRGDVGKILWSLGDGDGCQQLGCGLKEEGAGLVGGQRM